MKYVVVVTHVRSYGTDQIRVVFASRENAERAVIAAMSQPNGGVELHETPDEQEDKT